MQWGGKTTMEVLDGVSVDVIEWERWGRAIRVNKALMPMPDYEKASWFTKSYIF